MGTPIPIAIGTAIAMIFMWFSSSIKTRS